VDHLSFGPIENWPNHHVAWPNYAKFIYPSNEQNWEFETEPWALNTSGITLTNRCCSRHSSIANDSQETLRNQHKAQNRFKQNTCHQVSALGVVSL